MKPYYYLLPKDFKLLRSPTGKIQDPHYTVYKWAPFTYFLPQLPSISYDIFVDQLLENVDLYKNHKLRILLPMPAQCTELCEIHAYQEWFKLLDKCFAVIKRRPDTVIITGCDWDEYNLQNFYNKNLVEIIINKFRNSQTSLKHLTWMHSNPFTDDYIKQSLLPNEESPQTIFYSSFIHRVNSIPRPYKPDSTFSVPKTHWFLSLNRISRPHRLYFCYWWYKNSIRPGHISCRLSTSAKDEQLIPIEKLKNVVKIFSDDESIATNFLDTLPWSLDYKNTTLSLANQDYLDKHYIETSACYILTETMYPMNDSNKNYRGLVCEKVYKSFLYGLPYIALGVPETIAATKKIGFLSYSSLIDESYDLVFDGKQRMKMVLEEVRRIQKIDDINRWYQSGYEIYVENLKNLERLANVNYFQLVENFHI